MKLNDIKNNRVTKYTMLGLGITIVTFLVNFIVSLLNLVIKDTTGNAFIATFLVIMFFLISLFLIGFFSRPILELFGYKLVKK